MAKKRQRAKPSDEKIVRELGKFHEDLHMIFCSSLTAELALGNNIENAELEIARCLKHHVVEELWRLGEQLDFIMMDIGGKPRFMPINDDDNE